MSVPPAALIDGRPGEAVPVRERGLHYGDGLFETIACLAGRPRLLGRHLERLGAGCRRLRIEPPSAEVLAVEIAQLAAGHARSVVKVLVLRGSARARGYALGGEVASRVLLGYPWPGEPPLHQGGVRVRRNRSSVSVTPRISTMPTRAAAMPIANSGR